MSSVTSPTAGSGLHFGMSRMACLSISIYCLGILWNFSNAFVNIKSSKVNFISQKLKLRWTYDSHHLDFIVIECSSFSSLFRPKCTPDLPTHTLDEDLSGIWYLCEIFGTEKAEALASLSATGAQKSTSVEVESLSLAAESLSKEDRKNVHQAIRHAFQGSLDSRTDTSDSATSILVTLKGKRSLMIDEQDTVTYVNPNQTKNEKKRGAKKRVLVQRWDNTRGQADYQQATLAKVCLTTSDAVDRLARGMGLLPSRIGFAGTKDRMALTLQDVSAWRVTKETLEQKEHRQLAVRDVRPAEGPVRLGQLQGNFFSVVLRNDEAALASSDDTLGSSRKTRTVAEMEGQVRRGANVGYLNLFGGQRFGHDNVTAEVGRLLVQNRYRDAILLLLLVPTGRRERHVAGARLRVETICRWLAEGEEAVERGWREYSAFLETMAVAPRRDSTREGEGEGEAGDAQGETDVAMSERDDSGATWIRSRVQCIDDVLSEANVPCIPRGTPFIQRSLLNSLAKEIRRRSKQGGTRVGLDWKNIFHRSLPRNSRLLFVNALQSQLFNDAIEAKAEACGSVGGADVRVREGDLVLLGEDGAPLSVWDAAYRNTILVGNQVLHEDDDDDDDDDDDHGDSIGDSQKRYIDSLSVSLLPEGGSRGVVHTVTAAEAAAHIFPAESLIVAMPGDRTRLTPDMAERLARDNVSMLTQGSSAQPDALFRVPGAYRHVLTRAQQVYTRRPPSEWTPVSTGPPPPPFPASCGDDEEQRRTGPVVRHAFVEDVAREWRSGQLPRLLAFLEKERTMAPNNGQQTIPPILREADLVDALTRLPLGPSVLDDCLQISFCLPSSCYATIFLDHLQQRKSDHGGDIGEEEAVSDERQG